MDTVQEFFEHELANIDRAITQIQQEIDASPSANGRHAGMRALHSVQCRHRRTVELLATQASDFDRALDLCRLYLIAAERKHARISAYDGARNLRCADAWWDSLDEMQFLTHLLHRLQDAAHPSRPRRINGAG